MIILPSAGHVLATGIGVELVARMFKPKDAHAIPPPPPARPLVSAPVLTHRQIERLISRIGTRTDPFVPVAARLTRAEWRKEKERQAERAARNNIASCIFVLVCIIIAIFNGLFN